MYMFNLRISESQSFSSFAQSGEFGKALLAKVQSNVVYIHSSQWKLPLLVFYNPYLAKVVFVFNKLSQRLKTMIR